MSADLALYRRLSAPPETPDHRAALDAQAAAGIARLCDEAVFTDDVLFREAGRLRDFEARAVAFRAIRDRSARLVTPLLSSGAL